ncbi:uncharacterized protein AAEQ78_026110 isoform 1-T1 [Lycaon pictus]
MLNECGVYRAFLYMASRSVDTLTRPGSLKCKWCRGTDYNAAPIKVFGCHNALTSTSRLSSSTGVGKRKVDLCFLFSFPKSESIYRRLLKNSPQKDHCETRQRVGMRKIIQMWSSQEATSKDGMDLMSDSSEDPDAQPLTYFCKAGIFANKN